MTVENSGGNMDSKQDVLDARRAQTEAQDELSSRSGPTITSPKLRPETENEAAATTEAKEDKHGVRPSCFSNLTSECAFVLTTTFAIGQQAILNGILMVMTSRIQEGLNMTTSEVTWLVAGINLTSGAFLLFFGRVADLFGRRLLLVSSMGLFTALMLVAGFSQTPIMALVLIALSGITCASVVPPALGKLGAIYDRPSRRKNRAFACFSAGNPVGFVIGALIGGVVTEISTWRVCFWVVAVIYGFFTVLAWFTTPEDAEQALGGLNLATMKEMDWLGALLAVAGIALFTAAFTLAPEAKSGWQSPEVIVMLILGVVLLAVFLYWQSVFSHPLMPLNVWRDRNFSLLVSTLCLCFYGFNQNFFWLALGWQRVYENSPLIVAVKLLPAVVGGCIVNVIAGMIMHRVSNKLLMIIAAVSMVISSTLLSASSKAITYWALSFPSLIFSVIGADFLFCVTNMYVMSSLPAEKQSVAGGLLQTVTRLASTIGLGVSTTVFASAGGSTEISTDGPWRPYQATFWVSLVGAFIGLGLTPFLTIKRQGNRQDVENEAVSTEKKADQTKNWSHTTSNTIDEKETVSMDKKTPDQDPTKRSNTIEEK